MNSTVLITGCSTGFGRATAELFHQRGWNVVATMRKPNPYTFKEDDRLMVTPMDVTKRDTVEAAFQIAQERFGSIGVLVNNAGIGLLQPLEITPDATMREIFETNTFGLMSATQAVLPQMREQGGGTIINVTSSVTVSPFPYLPIYTASKAAVEGFSESLFHELAPLKIRVKLVEPGMAPSTAFASNVGERMNVPVPEVYRERVQALMDSMRSYPYEYTNATHVAEAIFRAATDDSATLRYPAGPDSEALAELRRTLPEAEFLERVRKLAGGS